MKYYLAWSENECFGRLYSHLDNMVKDKDVLVPALTDLFVLKSKEYKDIKKISKKTRNKHDINTFVEALNKQGIVVKENVSFEKYIEKIDELKALEKTLKEGYLKNENFFIAENTKDALKSLKNIRKKLIKDLEKELENAI